MRIPCLPKHSKLSLFLKDSFQEEHFQIIFNTFVYYWLLYVAGTIAYLPLKQLN